MDNFELAKQHFMEGLRLLETKNLQGAELEFTQSLQFVPDRVSTLNNLSAIKLRLKKFGEAEELALKAIALDDKSPEAWSNLGAARSATKGPEEALAAYERALECNSGHTSAWFAKATTLFGLQRFDEALVACDRALKLEPGYQKVLYTKSQILKKIGQTEEAQKFYVLALKARVQASPVFISERRANQRGDLLIINQNPAIDDSLKSFEDLHLEAPNFPGQLIPRFRDDFHFTFVFVDDALRPGARNKIPAPEVVINNHLNGEAVLAGGRLAKFSELMDSFGVPVVNHPTKVILTTRDESAKRLAGTPGVVLPKTLRFSSTGKTPEEMARQIEKQYDYPLILRTLACQEGKGMTKVDSREVLVEVLASGFPKEFFVTQFVDSRAGKKFYRKIRAAVVKDEIIIVRVDCDTYWKIYARKSDERVSFYRENAHLLEEEKRICQNPEAELGRPAVEALRAIRQRVPLDVFGIDFDVDGNGLVVFYEANATMNLFSTAREEVPYPQEAEDRLKQAFRNYLTSLVARGS